MRYFVPRTWTGWRRIDTVSEETTSRGFFFGLWHSRCTWDIPGYFHDVVNLSATLSEVA